MEESMTPIALVIGAVVAWANKLPCVVAGPHNSNIASQLRFPSVPFWYKAKLEGFSNFLSLHFPLR